MEIIGYRVDIAVGSFTNTAVAESKEFYGGNPLQLRRQAHKYAKKIFDTIKEASDEGVVNYKTENLLGKGVETFMPLVNCVYLNEEEEEDELLIYGTFIEEMFPAWEDETTLYIDCEYDTEGELYALNCPKYYAAGIFVLKDIYEMWHEECENSDNE